VLAYVRSLNPRLPRSVYTLQAGGFFNAVGNGIVFPFTFIYLHNVRGISLGMAGLIIATNAGVSIVAGPIGGILVDRVGGRRMLGVSLAFLAVGFAMYPFVHVPWQGFVASSITGIGNGLFWPAQSTLIAGLTPVERRPAAFSMQRVVMNLGIGIGGVMGGLIASTENPWTFTVLFLVDAATFLVYLGVLGFLVPEPELGGRRGHGDQPGTYRDVFRNRPFAWLLLVNVGFIAFGMSQLEMLPVYAKNEAGLSETQIGFVFFVNTLVIVALQLPITKLSEGRRRMAGLALVGVFWAAAWALVPVSGLWLAGAAAFALLALVGAIFAIGECFHGAVQAPLVADLAEPRLLGRYMALSALTWQVGFTVGPAVGGFVLSASPTALWLGAAVLCLATGVAALALEPALPVRARRTPIASPAPTAAAPVSASA
jgi:MFS family permease